MRKTLQPDRSYFVIAINIVVLIASLLMTNYIALTIVLLYFSVLLVYYSRDNLFVLLSTLFIAYSNYGIAVYRYWAPHLMPYNEITTSTGNIDEVGLKVSIFLIFVILFFVGGKRREKYILSINGYVNKKDCNPFLVLVSCVAIILIWILFYDFDWGRKAGYSPQYEYSIVFFILGLRYAGNNKKLIIPFLFLGLFYLAFDFLGGQRSTGVQIAIVFALMVFPQYLNAKRILLYGIIGAIMMRFVAALRQSLFMPDFTFGDILNSVTESYFAPDTAGAAYYSSLVYIATMQFYDFGTRISQFGDFVASMFVVGTVGEALPYIALKHFWHGFGGVIGIYMYYYLGYIGTALIGTLVGFYYRLMEKVKSSTAKRSSIYYVIVVYVSATTIRWYLYSPNQLIRGVMLLSVVYYLYYLTNKVIKSKKL